MRSRQRGATALGMLSIVAVLGFGLYGVIRLAPVYLEYMAVVRALESTAKETSGSPSQQSLRTALIRRWTIEDITSLQPKDVEIRKVNGGFTLRAYYSAERPFVGNVSLLADFDKTVDVKGP